MRTTVDIDDKLLTKVKATAVDQGKTLSAVVNEALREFSFARKQPSTQPWVPVTFDEGGLRPGVDIDSNSALEEALGEPSTTSG